MDFLNRLSDLVDYRLNPRNYHIFLLFFFALVITAAVLVTASTERVAVAGIQVPSLCLFKLSTGLDCPACGITRALVLALDGQWLTSYRMHIWGIPLALLIAIQIPYRISVALGGRELSVSPTVKTWIGIVVLLSLVLPWAFKLAASLAIGSSI